MTKTLTLATTVALAATLLATAPAHAANPANGNFAAGLTGWTSAGSVAVDSTGQFGPPGAGQAAQAVLGTAATSGFLFGGSATGAATLDSFAGLGAGTLAGLGGVAGSALRQDINAGSGGTLSFWWKLMTDEPATGSSANDTAFVVLDGALTKLTSVQSAPLLGGSPSPMLDETAYAKASLSLGAGSHTLAFGIVDVPDTLGASALAISDVQVASVPEPASWAMALAGLGLLLNAARRRGRQRG